MMDFVSVWVELLDWEFGGYHDCFLYIMIDHSCVYIYIYICILENTIE